MIIFMTENIKNIKIPRFLIVNKFNIYFLKKVADLFAGLTINLYL